MSTSGEMRFTITGEHESGDVRRAFLILDCGYHCPIPLTTGAAAHPKWHWDGKTENTTVSPSIHCSSCGFHKTLTNGVWRE